MDIYLNIYIYICCKKHWGNTDASLKIDPLGGSNTTLRMCKQGQSAVD